jgi:hypothetical protein
LLETFSILIREKLFIECGLLLVVVRGMAKLVVEVPELLGEEMGKIEREVKELISLEEKRKLLSLFIDEVMKGAKQLSEEELVELGREVKRGRFEKLKQSGLV